MQLSFFLYFTYDDVNEMKKNESKRKRRRIVMMIIMIEAVMV